MEYRIHRLSVSRLMASQYQVLIQNTSTKFYGRGDSITDDSPSFAIDSSAMWFLNGCAEQNHTTVDCSKRKRVSPPRRAVLANGASVDQKNIALLPLKRAISTTWDLQSCVWRTRIIVTCYYIFKCLLCCVVNILTSAAIENYAAFRLKS